MNLLEATRAVFASGLGPNEKLVALALLNHWSRARDTFPSVKRLGVWTSLHRTTIMRAITALEGYGVLVVTRANGRANRYELGGLTGLPQRPVSHSDRSPTATPPVADSDTTSRSERPDQSLGATRSDPGSDPISDPRKGEPPRELEPVIGSQVDVYLTDGSGRHRVDPFAESFARAGEVERYAFAAWAKAFGKSGAQLDSKRESCLRERVRSGMTQQDADDAIAGAQSDDWIIGAKTGKRNDRLTAIFGDQERYEEFLDLGRKQRNGRMRKVKAAQSEAEYQARIREEAAAHHAAAAAAGGDNLGRAMSVAEMTEGIGG